MPQAPLRYLGHELICDGLVILESDFPGSQRPLQEEPQRQLSQLGLDQRADGLMSEGEDLLAFLLPLIILRREQTEKKTQGD